ncbi:CHAT domain-containing protein, partial [Mycena leptocephala]
DLGVALFDRFELVGNLDDLNKCLLVEEDALSLIPPGDPEKPTRLCNLASSLFTRFERLGNLEDLHKSVLMEEEALALTPKGHPDRQIWLNNLASSLSARFERFGDLEDLNKSVLMEEEALALAPGSHPDRPIWLNNLAGSLFTRFERFGNLEDLHKSVSMEEEALALTPEGNPDRPIWLNNLANSLFTRFERFGVLEDLNKSILMGEETVALTPEGHPDRPMWLNNLANTLRIRFERFGHPEDLNKSVLMHDNAVSLTSDGHPQKPWWLNNFANALRIRFERFGDLDDLNAAVLMHENAVSLTSDEHLKKPLWLSNLAKSLITRFEQLGDLADLDKSVSMYTDAISLTQDGHHQKPTWMNDLPTAYVFALRNSRLRDHNDLTQMFLHYRSAAYSTTGAARVRFDAASTWAHLARTHGHSSILDAYQVALDLLPELAWLGLSVSDRHHHLIKAGVVVRDAAAAAITFGLHEKAVVWLEQGRSIIWGQFLSLRTPVDDLRDRYPLLADELVRLSTQLEVAGTRQTDLDADNSGTEQSLQSIAQQAHENAHKRAELLRRIRELKGFDRFLLPKTISELLSAAQRGSVIIVNLSSTTCDVLVLKNSLDNQVVHVPIPEFTPQHAETLIRSIGNLVPYGGRSDRLIGDRKGNFDSSEDQFSHILSELWVKLVKPVLNVLSIKPVKDNWKRIWWCPTGPLASLPIHAAGLYGKDEGFGSKLADFVVSSYTPSLVALIEGFRARSELQMRPQLLAVGQSSSSGQSYLPGTQEEIERIEAHARDKLPVLRLEEHSATVDSVQQAMTCHSWVHFACHGVQRISNPTESALLLAEQERLTLSSIIKLSLPHADFAFLSACQTATGDRKLQEEAVHLAAGMLLAGYRGVIATMWTIMDTDAPQVAGDVYEHMFKISPDPTRAAEALHLAIRKLREDSSGRKPFFRWVPFIHVGA